ncbi:MAG TPA: carbon storage regulator [Bryobacteraceae bacterium]|nr:carbon storage regulator [Bryobacteraceae bacterium]
MLVIRRRPGETLLIGGEIEVEVLEIASSQVKLGIRAPKQIVVLRKEIQITRQENLAASREKSGSAVNSLLRTLKERERAPIRAL